MVIIGAGLSGLLAANILRKHNPTVYEIQDKLPNNHTALLRHREHKISEATSIPFKKVRVSKAVNLYGDIYHQSTMAMCNMYSLKVTGGYYNRSIHNIEPVERYIAPPDFISKLAMGVNIKYGCAHDIINQCPAFEGPVISTVPMPAMWEIYNRDAPKPVFEYRNISTATFDILEPECDLYQTVYYPNPELGVYRLSITGKRVIAEFIGDIPYRHFHPRHGVANISEYIEKFLEEDFGIKCRHTPPATNQNNYGKIVDIDTTIRRKFIRRLTDEYNIYSLGRFATWRNLLLDDVYDDILVIQKLMEQKGH